MAEDNVLKYSLIIIASISLCLIFLIGSFSGLYQDKEYYDSLYQKSGAYERLSREIVDNKTVELFNFFNDEGTLDKDFYTDNEVSHMNDVKRLIDNIFIIYSVALFILFIFIGVVYKYFRVDMKVIVSKMLILSGIIIVASVIILLLVDFSGLFERFHQLFFSGNYTFPESSNMLKLFSEDFFRLFVQKIFTLTLIKGIVAIAGGMIILYKKKIMISLGFRHK